jgi:excisionase family DNA binding protein
MTDREPATYSIREVSKILGIGLNQTYLAAERGALAPIAIRVGRRILIPKAALRRLLAGEPVIQHPDHGASGDAGPRDGTSW